MAAETKKAVQDIVNRAKAYNCLECGKCSSVCPISLLNEKYSPRVIVGEALLGAPELLLKNELLWSCLSCGLCYERCELDVNFPKFIRDLRVEAHKIGQEGVYAHGGAIQSWMAMMTSPNLKQNRLDWIPEDLKIQEKGEFLYFVGCLPYFDTFFSELELNTLETAKSTIKILNHLGIEPVIMANERCCGHDFLWTGDIENFKKLAQQNIEEIKRTEAKKLITSCPEGYYTLKEEYPKYVGRLGVEVIHISQFLAEKVSDLDFKKVKKRVSYQDPCRLGRFSGIYEEPRNIMTAIEGIELHEMERNRKNAICCGTSGWMSCGTYSKQIQTARLKEAKNTGADLLITSCPKCQIHFKCAQSDKNIDETKINIQDMTTLIASCLK